MCTHSSIIITTLIDQKAYISLLFQALLAVYLIVVVLLVRRQIYQVEEEGMERIIITDKRRETGIRKVREVLSDKKEVLM